MVRSFPKTRWWTHKRDTSLEKSFVPRFFFKTHTQIDPIVIIHCKFIFFFTIIYYNDNNEWSDQCWSKQYSQKYPIFRQLDWLLELFTLSNKRCSSSLLNHKPKTKLQNTLRNWFVKNMSLFKGKWKLNWRIIAITGCFSNKSKNFSSPKPPNPSVRFKPARIKVICQITKNCGWWK